MHHGAEIHRAFEVADVRADRDHAGFAIAASVEHLRRVAKIDAQLEQGAARAGEIFMHEMRGADVVAVMAVFPIAEDVIARMPELVLLGAAQPGEPPMHHFGAASGHACQRGHQPLAVGEIPIAGFERQIAGIEQIVGLTEFHLCLLASQLHVR
jgi:hypothetical protein